MKKILSIVFCVLLVFIVLACGPTLGSQIQITTVPEPSVEPPEFTRQPSVTIGFFKDVRPGNYVVKHYETLVQPSNSVSFEVEDVLRRTLVNAGFLVNSAAPVIIKGEIRQWVVDIKSNFPIKLDSKATLWIEIIGPDNKRIYSGIYLGTGHFEKVAVENKDLQNTLNIAMTAAISGIVKDKKLLSILSSF
ncbi:MAG: YajG family lipoprotein [Deltaproteobacteria bacterium]|jgi:uncharacterized lipoprotein YajG|nr:YajG family lipoprotein [Deltaproteobacteria bacterium]